MPQTNPKDSVLKAGDSLTISTSALKIFRNSGNGVGLPVTSFKVDLDFNGDVNLPDVGAVHIEGLSISQARDAVADAYQKCGLMSQDDAPKLLVALEGRTPAKHAIDHSGLKLKLAEFYTIDSGDVLGMYIIPFNEAGTPENE